MTPTDSAGIRVMRHRLRRLQQAQELCVNGFGYVDTSKRVKYNLFCRRAAEYRNAIKTLEDIYQEKDSPSIS